MSRTILFSIFIGILCLVLCACDSDTEDPDIDGDSPDGDAPDGDDPDGDDPDGDDPDGDDPDGDDPDGDDPDGDDPDGDDPDGDDPDGDDPDGDSPLLSSFIADIESQSEGKCGGIGYTGCGDTAWCWEPVCGSDMSGLCLPSDVTCTLDQPNPFCTIMSYDQGVNKVGNVFNECQLVFGNLCMALPMPCESNADLLAASECVTDADCRVGEAENVLVWGICEDGNCEPASCADSTCTNYADCPSATHTCTWTDGPACHSLCVRNDLIQERP